MSSILSLIPPDVPSIMLDTQYRMHPSISAFPSRAFYNASLKNGTVREDGSTRAGFTPPVTSFLSHNEQGERSNLTFVDHDYLETPQMRSIANYGDAEKVCDIATDLLLNNPVSCYREDRGSTDLSGPSRHRYRCNRSVHCSDTITGSLSSP